MNQDRRTPRSNSRLQRYQPGVRSAASPPQANPVSQKPLKPAAQPGTAASKTIEIKLTMPHVRPRSLFQQVRQRVKRSTKKQRIIAALLLLIIIAVTVGALAQRNQAQSVVQANKGTENPLDKLPRGTPDYPTILPAGKSANDLGGWTRVSPPDREKVFAYVDTISSVPISVSQQPLPADFKDAPDAHIKTLSLAYSADKSITAGSTKAYIGTSASGPQSVIFHKDGLLILMKSNATIKDAEWQKYIQSLS